MDDCTFGILAYWQIARLAEWKIGRIADRQNGRLGNWLLGNY